MIAKSQEFVSDKLVCGFTLVDFAFHEQRDLSLFATDYGEEYLYQ